MINTGLDKKFVAREDVEQNSSKSKDFSPVPKGRYSVEVEKVDDWKKVVKDVYINQRDENNKLVKDSDGNTVRALVKDVEYYNTNVRLKIVSGNHKGRILFTTLTTHPNASFITENFLFAINKSEMVASQIPTRTIGSHLDVDVEIETYNKKVTDPDTGIEKTEPKEKNVVKAFKKSNLVQSDDEFEV